MVEKSLGSAAEGEHTAPAAPAAAPGTPRRPGHRGMDPRETVAELTAKAHEISQQAGSKVAAAMKNVIGAAAGLTGFAVESARDLIQYMVRRGQMTQMEGDKLLREVEAAHGTRSGPPKADAAPRPAVKPAGTPPAKAPAQKAAPVKKASADAAPPAPKKAAAERPAAKKAEKPAEKAATAKTAAKKPAAKGAAKKAAAKGSASRSASPERPKAAAKSAAVKKKR